MTRKKIICIAVIAAASAIAITAAFCIKAETSVKTAEATAATDTIASAAESDSIIPMEDYESYDGKAHSNKELDSLKIYYDSLRNDYIQKVNFEQDLSGFSMSDLLRMRNGIYAVNGLFFKDENFNTYFIAKEISPIPWYRDYLCFLVEYEYRKKGGNARTYLDSNYLLYIKGVPAENERDIKLSDAEKQFVEKIDERIAELRKDGMYINKNGYTIGNAAHIVNLHKAKNLSKAHMEKIERNNFAIDKTEHLQLFHLYEQNQYARMPSFVTTDLFLQAFHMYLSYILKKLEQEKFISALEELSLGIYKASMDLTKSEDAEIAQIAKYNAAFYAIAYTLLTEKKLSVPAEYQDNYNAEVNFAIKASEDGVASKFLQGLEPSEQPMFIHYSLFKPRGHYTRKPELKTYFKAMMWLQNAFSCRDRTRHLKQSIFTANLLNTAKTEENKPLINIYSSIFEPTVLLVGEPNNLSIMDIAEFLKKEKVKDMSMALSAENVEKVNQKLISLAERILIKPKLLETCSDKINFMPQRYLIDNEVLQDLVDTALNAKRAFPKGLDVFSAFGSAPASDLLNNFYKEKEKWSEYTEEMAKLQKKFSSFNGWNKSAHNKWIESLLALQKTDKSYPEFMKTKAWGYKNLNTSLASWAELKHDFALYTDQPMAAESGDGGDDCLFFLPYADLEVGYVEPNLLFWNKLNELVKLIEDMLAKHDLLDDELKKRNDKLQSFITFLIEVSKKELAKKSLSKEDYRRIKFIGGEVEDFTLTVIEPGKWFQEWWTVKGPDRHIAVVADVYTRNMPNDQQNGILHVANGNANEIYAVVEIDGFLYLTRGATFSYYEFVMPESVRLTDEEWHGILEKKSERPAIPEWMRNIIADTDSKPEIPQYYIERYCFTGNCKDDDKYEMVDR